MTNGPSKTAKPDRPDDEPVSEIGQTEAMEEEIKALEESGEDIEELRRRYLLRRFWVTALGFWRGRGARFSWSLTAGLIVLILLNLAAAYAMNRWNRSIFDALEQKDAGAVLTLAMIYFGIL